MGAKGLTSAEIVGLSKELPAEIVERLARLRRWDIATANPFILKLLNSHSRSEVATAEIAEILHIIESFAVRRTICGVPTNQLKRIFLAVTKEMPRSQIAEWLRSNLAAGQSGRRWPRDEEFRDSLLRYRAYAQPIERCKFILESLEDADGHKEPPSFANATIEHVMPRTLTDEWRSDLGTDYLQTHERWLDNIGNLTLSGYNPELSNASFEKKKSILAVSNFDLNRWISKRTSWTAVDILERTGVLFHSASKIWVGPPNS